MVSKDIKNNYNKYNQTLLNFSLSWSFLYILKNNDGIVNCLLYLKFMDT